MWRRHLSGGSKLERSWGPAKLLRACARLLWRRERLPLLGRALSMGCGSIGICMDCSVASAMQHIWIQHSRQYLLTCELDPTL